MAELNRLEIFTNQASELLLNSTFNFDTRSLLSQCPQMYACNIIDIIVGIDFTASNEWKGRKTFNQQCLHKIVGTKPTNPYQRVIAHLGIAITKLINSGGSNNPSGSSRPQDTQSSFNSGGNSSMDVKVYAYGFGDSTTRDKCVFSLVDQSSQHKNILVDQSEEDNYFESFDQVLLK